jgi:beta-lactamase regulating signal transducer with metallopeptidase domain
MFAARGFAVSSSTFFILYSVLSLVVCLVWRRVWVRGHQGSARRCADLLFFLRMLPLVAAMGATFLFAVPSFLLLEPRAVEESMGAVALVLGCCGTAVMLAGAWNAVAASVRAARTVAGWSIDADARVIGNSDADSKQPVCVMRTAAPAPPLTAAGILRPRVWLSCAAEFVLTERELQSALRHEMVHVRRRDNLRKLFLRLVACPGMGQLECAWREATEMAADDAAVSSASEALDLAAAVIKLSRLAPLQPPAELATALVHSPAESVNARVERLIRWTEARQSRVRSHSLVYTLWGSGGAAAITIALTYCELLVRVHAATEWLVR